ncbi:unnamed protein product [Dibothriocephalus latus]|uniref:Uncharacterized protein n=1 Tax=Dibothriocephalus latus TaxID=60516 RepID=A0A3P7PXY3_DIBLA|nr:unnamed protein product [Dibothriocephalus latus]
MECVTAISPPVERLEPSGPQAFSTYFNIIHRAASAYQNPGLPSFLHIRTQPSQFTVSGAAPSLRAGIQPTLPPPTPLTLVHISPLLIPVILLRVLVLPLLALSFTPVRVLLFNPLLFVLHLLTHLFLSTFSSSS